MWPFKKRKRLTITKIEFGDYPEAVVTADGMTFIGTDGLYHHWWYCLEEARECSYGETRQLWAAARAEWALRRVRKAQEARDE